MNKLIELLIFGLLVMLKLILTGICLAIGFSIGGIIVNKTKAKVEKRKKPKTKE